MGSEMCIRDRDNPADYQTAASHAFTVRATDNAGNTTDMSFNITVNDTTKPVINTGAVETSVNDGATALGTIAANETVSWSIDPSNSGVSVAANGVLTLDASANYHTAAAHAFTVRADDGSGNVVDTPFNIPVNDTTKPVITSSVVSSVNDGIKALGSVAADEDVSWSIIDGSGVSVDTNGVLTLDNPPDFQTAAVHAFTVRADDGSGNVVDTQFSIAVNDITDPIVDTTGVVSVINDDVLLLELSRQMKLLFGQYFLEQALVWIPMVY